MFWFVSFNSVVFQPQFIIEIKQPVGQSVTRVCFSCLLVLVNIFLCEGNLLHCMLGNQESSSTALLCWSVPVFHRHPFLMTNLPILECCPIKVSTVICIGSCFAAHLRYKRICLHFGSLFYSKSFLCLSSSCWNSCFYS
jgi:hypothetical protein